jgi:hypothetical protein
MINLKPIYEKANKVMEQTIIEELRSQGHYLTGELENSINGKVTDDGVEGFALDYQKFMQRGFPASSASWKQFPFVVKYFIARGYSEEDSKRYAAMTINKWKKYGMPTPDSRIHSSNGFRTNFLDRADRMASPQVDQIITDGIDKEINDRFFNKKVEVL